MIESFTRRDLWKRYDIFKAEQNIVVTWNDVQITDMNCVLKKLCPQMVNDFKCLDNFAINKIGDITQRIGNRFVGRGFYRLFETNEDLRERAK